MAFNGGPDGRWMRRVVVVANSILPARDIVRALCERADAIVAADGAVDRLPAYGLEADHVVGDMDSASPEALRRLGRSRVHARRSPYRTDLEKAIEFAHENGAREIDLVGFAHGRLDHVMASVSVLMAWSDRIKVRLHDDDFEVFPVKRKASFRAPKGTLVSLFSPSKAEGVTTTGLRWPLKDATLERGTLGIHNEVAKSPCSVAVRSGELLLFKGRRVEPHR